jgi:hypothetical protein
MPGLHCLRIETLLQVHYLCFKTQSTRDAWLKELQDRVAEVTPTSYTTLLAELSALQ